MGINIVNTGNMLITSSSQHVLHASVPALRVNNDEYEKLTETLRQPTDRWRAQSNDASVPCCRCLQFIVVGTQPHYNDSFAEIAFLYEKKITITLIVHLTLLPTYHTSLKFNSLPGILFAKSVLCIKLTNFHDTPPIDISTTVKRRLYFKLRQYTMGLNYISVPML